MSRSPHDRSEPSEQLEASDGGQSYHHGNLRQTLLDAGLQLLRETPATSLSMRQVAREAGVSHGAPYHHFADRSELVGALGTEILRQFVEMLAASVTPTDGPLQQLLSMGTAYLRFALEQPHEFTLVFDPVLCPPDDPRTENIVYIDAVEEQLFGLTAQAQERGELPPGPPDKVGNALWGLVHGMASLVSLGYMSYEDAVAGIYAIVGATPNP